MQRTSPRVLGLLAALGSLCAQAARPVSPVGRDAGALFQRGLEVHSAALVQEARAAGGAQAGARLKGNTDPLRPTAMVFGPFSIEDVLHGILNGTATGNASSATGAKSRADPDEAEFDVADFTKLMKAMFEAVKSEDFMRAINQLAADEKNLSHDLAVRVRSSSQEFLNSSQSTSREQMVTLAAAVLNNFTHEMQVFIKGSDDAAERLHKAMPPELTEAMEKIRSVLTAQADYLAAVPEDLPVPELCAFAGRRLANLTEMGVMTEKSVKVIDAAKKFMPDAEKYLTEMRPDVAPRMMWILQLMIDMDTALVTDINDAVHGYVEDVRPPLNERLGCGITAAASRGALGPGLLAALAWLAVSRL